MGRPREKDAVENYRSLDINALRRAGALQPGYAGGWQWSLNGEVRARIGLAAVSRDQLRLHYQVSYGDRPKESKDYPVALEWTGCHLGGDRPWFRCPACNRRVGKLCAGVLFICRHCLRLNYASQQASKRDVASDRSWKLRRALGCDDGYMSIPAEFIRKPKGMHWRTFHRKLEQLKQVEARAWADMNQILTNLTGAY